jgi:hypothetical protein
MNTTDFQASLFPPTKKNESNPNFSRRSKGTSERSETRQPVGRREKRRRAESANKKEERKTVDFQHSQGCPAEY